MAGCECEGAGIRRCGKPRVRGSSRCADCDFDLKEMGYRCACDCGACDPSEYKDGQHRQRAEGEALPKNIQGGLHPSPLAAEGGLITFWEPHPRVNTAEKEASGSEARRPPVVQPLPASTRRRRTLPEADGTVAARVTEMLARDNSDVAIRADPGATRSLCVELFDTSTAQPDGTNEAQASAWVHWEEWCAVECTPPWRCVTAMSEAENQREAVLAAGFPSCDSVISANRFDLEMEDRLHWSRAP